MDSKEIFTLALGLEGTPWKVDRVDLDTEKGALTIGLNFEKGSRFTHPASGELCPVYDSRRRRWRHMNFFQFCCYLEAKVPRVGGGKDHKTLEETAKFLKEHGGEPDQIQMVCSDMSPAYRKGFNENFPKAVQVTDYFHVVQKLTEAVSQVRLKESKQVPELLKRTKYLWIKKESKLNPSQKEKLHRLCSYKLKTAKAHMILVAFQDLLMAKDFDEALGGLKWRYFWATHSRIPEMVQAAKNLKDNCWDGLINYLKYRLTNAAAEAMNGLIQSAKRKAHGFRTFSCFRIAIYLLGSRLKFDLPQPIPAYPHNS
jgi:transposase